MAKLALISLSIGPGRANDVVTMAIPNCEMDTRISTSTPTVQLIHSDGRPSVELRDSDRLPDSSARVQCPSQQRLLLIACPSTNSASRSLNASRPDRVPPQPRQDSLRCSDIPPDLLTPRSEDTRT